jgi:hypothetical protein
VAIIPVFFKLKNCRKSGSLLYLNAPDSQSN